MWPTVSTRRLFRIVNGGTPSADPKNWDGDVNWATPADLATKNGGHIKKTRRTITNHGLAIGSGAVPAASLVVSTRAPIGYVVETLGETAFNQGCRGLVPTTTVDIRYFRYQFHAAAQNLAAHGLGSTFMELSSGDLGSFELTNPPLRSQRVVADFLDAATTRIDALISKKRMLMILVRDRWTSAVDELFGSTVRYSSTGVPNILGDHSMVRLGALAAVRSGLTLDGARAVDSSAVVRPYLRVANVQDGFLDLDEVKEVTVPASWVSRFELERGDVLMTEGGDPDKLGRGTVWQGEIEHCLHQNHIFSVRPTEELLPEYLALVTRTTYARTYFEMTASKTTGIASTSSTKISCFRVPMIPIVQQRQIVAEANAHHDRAAGLRRRLSQQIELLQEHRQALIKAAVTGEMDVSGVAE